nr:MAG: Histone-like Protein p6 [Bacteriophage sp.]
MKQVQSLSPALVLYSTKLYLDVFKKIKKERKKNMARVPMVTRTIITTKVNVMCLDIETGEPCNKSVVVPRTYKDDEKLLKKVKEVLETETLKPVHIVDKEEIETLYGMTEQDFIEHAEVQPARKVAEENLTE